MARPKVSIGALCAPQTLATIGVDPDPAAQDEVNLERAL